MARRLFFISTVDDGIAELRGDEAKHLSRVLRVEPGQIYELSDNHQKYLGKITTVDKDIVRFEIIETLPPERDTPAIHLYVAIIKFEHFEWGIEKATELGVNRIVPVQASRTEHGLDKAVAKRMDRWRRILVESSQQSRRSFLPELGEPMRFRDVVAQAAGVRLILDENREGQKLAELGKKGDPISLLIGPEGGWTDEERVLASSAGWKAASLGPRILRAETAWLAALAILRA